MINKLALFCYRNNLSKKFGLSVVIGVVICIVLVVVFSVLKVPATNGFKAVMCALVEFMTITFICALTSFLLETKAEKFPEMILEKAIAISKEGLRNKVVQEWLDQCIAKSVDNKNFVPLLETFNLIEKIAELEKEEDDLIASRISCCEQLDVKITSLQLDEIETIAKYAVSAADRFCL